MKYAIPFLLATATMVHADVLRPQCQTEESRGLRFTSTAMFKAADESAPWRGCGNGCSMASSVADAGRATVERFRAEGRAALLRARALEAAHCPEIADAIINNGPTDLADKEQINLAFEASMQKEYERVHALRVWQREHPQCEHVEWSHALSSDEEKYSSHEDFSGNFQGKKGYCSASYKGESWRGTKDDMTMSDPVTNDRIAKVNCAHALGKFGFGEGSYADPKLCEGSKP